MKRLRSILGISLILAFLFAMQANTALAQSASPTSVPTCGTWQDSYDPLTSGPPYGYLWDITQVNSNDIWSVGTAYDYSTTTNQVYTMHWNGSTWSQSSMAFPSQYPSNLLSVAAVNSNDVWAVGNYMEPTQRNTLTLTEHWNGKQWSQIPSPNPSPSVGYDTLLGVTAISSDNVWAVGQEGTSDVIVEHWNGKQWSDVSIPAEAYDQLDSISGTSSHDIWAVGTRKTSDWDDEVPLIEHWDGSKWSVVPSPNVIVTSNLAYDGHVITLAPNNAWAVWGQTIEHWNGTRWSIVASPELPSPYGMSYEIRALAATSANDVWIAGVDIDTGPVMFHWNGQTWNVAVSPTDETNYNDIHALTVTSDRVWGSGTDYGEQPMIGYYCS